MSYPFFALSNSSALLANDSNFFLLNTCFSLLAKLFLGPSRMQKSTWLMNECSPRIIRSIKNYWIEFIKDLIFVWINKTVGTWPYFIFRVVSAPRVGWGWRRRSHQRAQHSDDCGPHWSWYCWITTLQAKEAPCLGKKQYGSYPFFIKFEDHPLSQVMLNTWRSCGRHGLARRGPE